MFFHTCTEKSYFNVIIIPYQFYVKQNNQKIEEKYQPEIRQVEEEINAELENIKNWNKKQIQQKSKEECNHMVIHLKTPVIISQVLITSKALFTASSGVFASIHFNLFLASI